MKRIKAIWISWETQRRSMELARALNVSYCPILYDGPRYRRYPVQIAKTIKLVKQRKPLLIYCQNPSILLATLTILLKYIYNYSLIVDRHTNFKFGTEKSLKPKWIIFHLLSKFTLKHADLTIVTNKALAKLIERQGAKSFVLQDKLPKITFQPSPLSLKGIFNFLFICTFSDDEPVQNVLDAFLELDKRYYLYITGDYKKFPFWRNYVNTPNIKFLGFVSEEKYMHYLQSCDATIVLTTQKYTLNCGSYESVVAGKPQLVSGSKTIRNYFTKGCIYIDNFEKKTIRQGIEDLIRSNSNLKEDIGKLRIEIDRKWADKFNHLQKLSKEMLE